jgi:selenocysteine-specific elongation factor
MPKPDKKTPEELEAAILEALGDDPKGLSTEKLCRAVGASAQALGTPFENLLKQGKVHGFAGLWISPKGFEEGTRLFFEALEKAHERQPTATLLPRERISHASGLNWAGKALDRILAHYASQRRIAVSGVNIRLRDFRPQLPKRQREFLDRVKEELEKTPIDVPNPHEIARVLGAPHQAVVEILKLGSQAGELLALGEGIYYTPGQIEVLKERVRDLTKGEPFGTSELRKALGTTRKYIGPLVEHFDEIEFTEHVDGGRKIRN